MAIDSPTCESILGRWDIGAYKEKDDCQQDLYDLPSFTPKSAVQQAHSAKRALHTDPGMVLAVASKNASMRPKWIARKPERMRLPQSLGCQHETTTGERVLGSRLEGPACDYRWANLDETLPTGLFRWEASADGH
ncbi:hypothetical protein D9M68_866110 [compost metagenome]